MGSPTGLQNLDNTADDPLIIDPRLAARIIRQKRFENSELILSQKQSRLIKGLLSETVNHKHSAEGIIFMGPDRSFHANAEPLLLTLE